jgi:hypothetical protein
MIKPKFFRTLGALPLSSPSGVKELLGSGPFFSLGSKINQRGLNLFALARAENQSFSSGELRSNSFRLNQKVSF